MAKSSTIMCIIIMVIALLFMVISNGEAKEHSLVGNSEQSWRLPLPQAQRPRQFFTGDSLLWKEEQGWGSSVLQVEEEDYHNCNKSKPMQSYSMKGGDDVKVVLKKPGSFYFISGTQGLCEQGMKLHVRVLSSYARFQGICGLCHPGDEPISSPPDRSPSQGPYVVTPLRFK